MAYTQLEDNGLDLNFDADKEERKRKLLMMAGLINGQTNVQDLASNLIDEKLQPIQQMVEDPQQAINQRLGMQPQQMQPQPQPQNIAGPIAPPMPDETLAETQRLINQNQQTPMAPVMPEVMQPTEQPLATGAPRSIEPQPVMPVNLEQPVERPEVSTMPQWSEGVQVAGPAVMPPQVPQWSKDLTDAQGDMTKLHAIAGNPNYPAEARRLAGELTAKAYKGKVEEDKANDTIQKAFSGQDPKALNSVMSDLRKDRSEGSYLKAILYGRLGLTELAREEQQKLGAGTKISQSMIEGKQYTVEYGGNGEVKRAWDSSGIAVGDDRLATISAGGMKPGTQAFGFTGESVTIPQGQPDAGQEYRQRTNSVTGQVENVISTGPNSGKLYTGSPGLVKSVGTAAAKIDYNLGADLYKKHSGNVIDMLKEYELIRGPQSPEQRQSFLNQYGYGKTISPPSLPGAQPQPQAIPLYDAQGQPTMVAPQQVQTRPQAQQNVQRQPGAAPSVSAPIVSTTPQGTGGRVQGGVPGGSISGMKAQQEIGVAGAKENIQVQGQRAQSFNKILDEEVRPQAQAGDTVSSVRKQQFAIFDRPGIDTNKIFGLYNAANESPGDQKLSIVRDIFGGMYKPEAEVSQRLALLNLTPEEKSALMEYNIANQRINAATLKQSAGPGSVSDAEQRANKESNVDPTKIPALGAYNAMAQSQFEGDKARYKADWALNQPATNALQLDKAWRKESQLLSQMYGNIAKQRAEFISKNGATTNAVREGYKRFPIPEYDPETEKWKKTKPLSEILGK